VLKHWRAWQQIRKVGARRRGRQLVMFYSHGRQDWPHLWPLATALSEESSAQILYVCATADDPGNLVVYPGVDRLLLDGTLMCAAFMATADADICVSTLPDLGMSIWKRSGRIGRYVFVPHSLVSCHMIYRGGAFDQFDEIFCAGPHHVAELRALEKQRNLSSKFLFEFGYPKLDTILHSSFGAPRVQSTRSILIAPSWGAPGLLERHGREMIRSLVDAGYRVVVRPHPETTKRSSSAMNNLRSEFSRCQEVTFDFEFDSASSYAEADLMISDWSGATFEYSFGIERPVLFVDIPRKVNNPDYPVLGIEPVEVWARERIGSVVAIDELARLCDRVGIMLDTWDEKRKSGLDSLRKSLVFNPGASARSGASRLVELLRSSSEGARS
jgi:hypothetical protein